MAPIKMEESDSSMRARLVESLSHSFPGSALSRALHAMNESDSEFSDCDDFADFPDPLSASCFSEIRLEKVKIEPGEEEEDDEELTSLSWLQDGDLLKNLSAGDRALCASPLDDIKENSDGAHNASANVPHPPNVPYNPQKHINSKPPYSFSCLIFMAIEDSPSKKLPVKDIYHWILSHFPYFQNAPTGWKNSVRHNLSLNKCFKKVEKEKGQGIGKGSLWCIDPDFRPNLLQALRKTPYHPYHQLQMMSNATSMPQQTGNAIADRGYGSRLNINNPSPHLFPFLSKRLAQSKTDGVATDDIDVANTLVSLKRAAESRRPLRCQNGWGGARGRRSPSPPEFGSEQDKLQLREKLRLARPPRSVVVTSVPSDDHTYSITAKQLKALMAPPSASAAPKKKTSSPSSSIDEEYEFGSDSEAHSSVGDSEFDESDGGLGRSHGSDLAAPFKLRLVLKQKEHMAVDEKEGAEALLNLAGIVTSSENNNVIKQEVKEEEEEQMDQS